MNIVEFSPFEKRRLYAALLASWNIDEEPTDPALIAREAWAYIAVNWHHDDQCRVLDVRDQIEEELDGDVTKIRIDIRDLRDAGLSGNDAEMVCRLLGLRQTSTYSFLWTNAAKAADARKYKPEGSFTDDDDDGDNDGENEPAE